MPGVVIPETFAQAFDSFRQSLLNDGKAVRTVESYCSDIEKFLLYLAGQGKKLFADLTRADVTRFIAGLSGRGFKPATVNKAVNSLSCFERFLKESGILPESARLAEPRKDRVKIAAGSEKEVSVFTREQVGAILALAGDREKTSQRNGLIINLLLRTPMGSGT